MHEHKYFIFQVKADFEPESQEYYTAESGPVQRYRRVEYAILGCACGDVIKQRVKNGDNQA